ncbi:MAG: HIT domain-containing protein [candidate division KSB1 bacterium]|jgi:ATP adenylyltransferase|nr:HIT domain-containing protein [candidate division KSB1 bacterium]
MDILWAPWRIDYILREKEDGCIFCNRVQQKEDRKHLILHRGKTCFVIMNYYPYNNGHVMVVPNRHIAELPGLRAEEHNEMMQLVSRSIEVISEKMMPHGFNIGMNLGASAGAGVKDHVHFHVVPRWTGDMNFMPVTGHTKVISEALELTWERLKDGFQ